MNEPMQVTALSTQIEADVAAARLAESGIEAYVVADNLGGTFPLMQMTTGGFKVFIRVEDEQRARAVLGQEYPPIESRPPPEVSRFLRTVRRVSSPKAARVRVAVYIVLTFVAITALVLSTTQGTL